MTIDKQTLQYIEANAVALKATLPETDNPAVLVPDNLRIESLEKFNESPYRQRGLFETARISAFMSYVRRYGTDKTAIFVSDRVLEAVAIFDFFDETNHEPGWKQHRARLKLRETPEWDKFRCCARNFDDHKFTQRDFLDFMIDWQEFLHFREGFGDSAQIDFKKAFQAVQRIEVKKNALSTHEDTAHRVCQSKIDEIDVNSSGAKLPGRMIIKCLTHVELTEIEVDARLMTVLDGDNVFIAYRIMDIERILEEAVDEFSSIISSGIKALSIPVFRGRFESRQE